VCTRRLCGVPSARASRTSASSVLWPAAGKITSRTTPFRTADRGLRDAEQDAGLAAHLDRFLDQLFQHAPLGFHCDPVRNLDQQLDQTVNHLRLARAAPESEQRQTNPVRVAAQLPGGLDRDAPAKTLDLLGMHATQQVRRERQAAQQFELADLRQQALQADSAGISGQARESSSFAGVGQQRLQPFAHASIQAIGHTLQRRVVMGGAGRAGDAIEPVAAWPADSFAGEPAAHLAFQCGRRRLVGQQLVGNPASEFGLGRVIESGDREVVENEAPVPASGSPGPLIAFQHIGMDANLGGL